MKLFQLTTLIFTAATTLALNALDGERGPRADASCGARDVASNVHIEARSTDGNPDALASTALGAFSIQIRATCTASDLPILVQCQLSPGLVLVQGALEFSDSGLGSTIVVEKTSPEPQHVAIFATATRDDGEAFRARSFYGAEPTPVLQDTSIQGDVTVLPATYN
jgi:hypothetical protein